MNLVPLATVKWSEMFKGIFLKGEF